MEGVLETLPNHGTLTVQMLSAKTLISQFNTPVLLSLWADTKWLEGLSARTLGVYSEHLFIVYFITRFSLLEDPIQPNCDFTTSVYSHPASIHP